MASRAGSAARSDPRHWPPPRRAPVALYVHFPFCVSLCPYCDFVVYAGAVARGPRNRVDALLAALETEIGLRADALDAEFGAPGGGGAAAAGFARTSAAGRRRSSTRPTTRRGSSISSAGGSGWPTTPRSPSRRIRAPTSAAMRSRSAEPGSPGSRSGRRASIAAELKRLGRRHRPGDVADAVARGARRRHRLDQPRPAVRRARRCDRDVDERRWTGRSPSSPDHLSLYALTLDDPDAEGLTGAGRRSPPDDGRRASLARCRPPGPGRGPRGCPVPPRGRPPRRGGLARLRDLELGPARPREPPQPGVLGAPPVRGRRARAPTPSTAPTGAGTPRGSMPTWRR